MKALFILVLFLCSCKGFVIDNHMICDSTVYNFIDSVSVRDSLVPRDSIILIDSIRIRDSIIYDRRIHLVDSIILRDSIIPILRDSIARIVKDTVRLIEAPGHNLYIQGATQHTTFYINMDSISVLIRNDSIIDAWERPKNN